MLLAVLMGVLAALLEGRSHDVTVGMGQFNPDPAAISEGYFTLNTTTLLAVMPGSIPHDLLQQIAKDGKRVTLIVRVD
jgi:hypothetical protein